ncbi:MAG: DM13 domain-containing protein [Chloroflexi bacterium]|nr:DM13 domain-containing protein [Chloroflexota bacterium]
MEIFGSIERLMSSLYPYRMPLTVASLVVAALLGWLVIRRGWHRPVLGLAARRPRLAGGLTLGLFVVAIPLGYYLMSPLWTRTTLEEASPLAVAAATAAPTAGVESVGSPTVNGSEATPTTAPTEPAATLPRELARGTVEGADEFHFGSGRALLIETEPGRFILRFEDFSVRNGPDLFVYLSDDPTGYGSDVLKLGTLKATDGSFNYDIPEGTDIARYRSAVVWCDRFAVLFATAAFQ